MFSTGNLFFCCGKMERRLSGWLITQRKYLSFWLLSLFERCVWGRCMSAWWLGASCDISDSIPGKDKNSITKQVKKFQLESELTIIVSVSFLKNGKKYSQNRLNLHSLIMKQISLLFLNEVIFRVSLRRKTPLNRVLDSFWTLLEEISSAVKLAIRSFFHNTFFPSVTIVEVYIL